MMGYEYIGKDAKKLGLVGVKHFTVRDSISDIIAYSDFSDKPGHSGNCWRGTSHDFSKLFRRVD